MKITIKTSFEKDIKKIKDVELRKKILVLISEIENLSDSNSIQNMKKLKGYKYSHRIAFNHNAVEYRVCVNIFKDRISIERFLPRSKSYRLFLL